MRPQENLEVIWQPFQLNPTMPAEGMERQSYLAAKFGGLERAERQNERLSQAGIEEGIEFNFSAISRTPNTINSHRMIYFAGLSGCQEPVVEALFRGFFYDGLDIGDLEVLTELGATSGLNINKLRRFLSGDDDRDVVISLDEKARQEGISGVPCYIIDGKFAVSGAQSPEIFHQIFELARQESAELAGQLAAE